MKWIFERTSDKAASVLTPIGHIPTPESLDLSGLKVDYRALFSLDRAAWKEETDGLKSYFQLFGAHFPKELALELCHLEERLL